MKKISDSFFRQVLKKMLKEKSVQNTFNHKIIF